MAPTSKCSRYINVTELGGYHTSLFEPEPFNPFYYHQESFSYEDHLYFDYDAFGDLIWDSPSAVSPCGQYYWDSVKDGTMLVVDDPLFKEWWTKYPGFDDCCGECPGCCAIEYATDTGSPKDPSSGSFGWFTFSIFSIGHNYVTISLGQW